MSLARLGCTLCARLSLQTRRTYRLPSETEWEFACRAGTATPFHFGETITTELANYDGTDDLDRSRAGSYLRGPKGESRNTTMSVDHFPVTNAFGLCDMHGNTWEWCLDHYHDSYEGAPINAKAWLEAEAKPNKSRVLRSGSWNNNPQLCRSAHRSHRTPRESAYHIGFRLVCTIFSMSAKNPGDDASNNKSMDMNSSLLKLLTLACQEGFQDRAIAQQLQISEAKVRALWEELYKVLGIDMNAEKADGRNLRITCCLRAQQKGLI